MISLIIDSVLGVMLLLSAAPRPASIKPDDWPILLFVVPMLILFSAGATTLGARMALETQRWIVGHDCFECQSQILVFRWNKRVRATAWRLEKQIYNGHVSYLLNPVGARVGGSILPFYTTSNPRQVLELGRQLANITGWPLRLSGEMVRLEQELEKELSL